MFQSPFARVILGVIRGLLPVVNNILAASLAFSRRRYGAGIHFLTWIGISITCLYITLNTEAKKKAARWTFVPAVEEQLATLKKNRISIEGNYDFADILVLVLRNAAAIAISKDSQLADLLDNAKDGHFGPASATAISRMSDEIQGFYPLKLEDYYYAGRDRFQPILNEEEKVTISVSANTVLNTYMEEELGWEIVVVHRFLIIGWGVGLIGNIVWMGRREAPAETDAAPVPGRNTAIPPVQPLSPETVAAPAINVNTAGENELAMLPGINGILAKGILAERRRNGYFTDVFDLGTRMQLQEEVVSNLLLITSFEVDRLSDQLPGDDPNPGEGGTERTGKGRIIEF